MKVFVSFQNMMDHFGLEGTMDGDWLDNFLIDPVVLNDRMISDAMQPQNVQSEHSYSLAKGETQPDSQLSLKMDTKEDKGSFVNKNRYIYKNQLGKQW